MSVKGAISQLLRWRTGRSFEQATWKPQEAQWKKLQQILRNNAQTEFGRQHGFDKIRSVKDYQAAVPIRDYEALRPWMERVLAGEQNVLTYQNPIYFCLTSSGVVGKPKPSPVTPDYRQEYQSVVHAFLYYTYREHPQAFDGQVLYFNGSADKGKAPSGVTLGSMSGFNSKNLPPLLKRFYAVPYEAMVLEEIHAHHFCIALLALPKNVSMMLAITASPMIMLARSLNQNAEALLKHLHDGSLPSDLSLKPEERKLIQSLHRAHPERARELGKVLEKSGQLSPKQVWPNLEVLVCWKSSTAGSLIPELERAYPGVTTRDAIYSATEGWCNVPYTDACLGGPLAIQAHFYEFIEAGKDENTAPVLQVHELEADKQYQILYTTSGGMYRYKIGDILQVSHFYHKTPSVYFARKDQQFSNMVTECLAADQVVEAARRISQTQNVVFPFYVMVPNAASYPPHYELYLELEPQDQERATELATALDQAIQEVNPDYGKVRVSGELGETQLIALAPGAFGVWRQSRVAVGAEDAQIKPPGLMQDGASLGILPRL